MTYKRVYCTICKTNHQMTKVKNGWYCIAKNHKQRSGKSIVYWQKPDYANSKVNCNKVGKEDIAGLKQTELKGKKTTFPTKKEVINAESLSVPANSSQPNLSKLSDFEEYLKAIRKKSRLCIHCNQPIENIRLKHAKYCKYCAEKIWKEQTKYVRKIKLLEK